MHTNGFKNADRFPRVSFASRWLLLSAVARHRHRQVRSYACIICIAARPRRRAVGAAIAIADVLHVWRRVRSELGALAVWNRSSRRPAPEHAVR